MGMEPEITRPGLAKTDPFVLPMIAANLNRQPTRRTDFQWLRLAGGRTGLTTAAFGCEQLQQFGFEILQLIAAIIGIIPVRPDEVIKKAFASIKQQQSLIVMPEPFLNQGNRTSESTCTLIELLGLVDALPVGIRLAQKRIGLALQIIGTIGVTKTLLLLPALRALAFPGLLQQLLKLPDLAAEPSLMQMFSVIETQAQAEGRLC